MFLYVLEGPGGSDCTLHSIVLSAGSTCFDEGNVDFTLHIYTYSVTMANKDVRLNFLRLGCQRRAVRSISPISESSIIGIGSCSFLYKRL